MRQKNIHTVDEYTREIDIIFNGSLKAKVKDLYIIGDFSKFFEPCIDQYFEAYAKEEDTQHCFKFEAVDVTPDFPYGVRTTYRAYASDKVIEFTKKPKNQCLSPIGRRTGLEPHTLEVTWGPWRDSNININKKVLGFYILKNIPSHSTQNGRAMFPPKDFKENSMQQFEKTVNEAKSRFVDRPEICAAWEKWEKEILGLGYANWSARDFATAKPELYQVPLLTYLRFPADQVVEANWDTTLKVDALRRGTDEFTYPAQTVQAAHSVRHFWQRDPMPSRIYATIDSELRERLLTHDILVTDYYVRYLDSTKFTVVKLQNILRQRLAGDGKALATNGKKETLINRIKESDKSYLSIFHKSLVPENLFCLSNLLQRPLKSVVDGEKNIHSVEGGPSINLAQIRQFNNDKSIQLEVVVYVMYLLTERMKLMTFTHSRIYGGETNYVALKTNLYLICSHDLKNIPIVEFDNIGKVFISFKESIEQDKDDWLGLVVDFNRKRVFYLDPSMSGNVILTAVLSAKLLNFKNIIYDWMGQPEEVFDCQMYPAIEHSFETIQNKFDSAIYLIACIDMVSHDCPRYFQQSDTFTFRHNICYSVYSNYMPY